MAVIPAGHSLRGGDAFFNDILRANRQTEIIVIDRDHETAGGETCTVLQLPPNQYTPITVQGHSAREYGNHVTVVGADLREVDLEEWLKKKCLQEQDGKRIFAPSSTSMSVPM